jgi:hypothetical protein
MHHAWATARLKELRLTQPLLQLLTHASYAAYDGCLPDPNVIAAQIVEDLQPVLAQFAEIASDLKK